MLALPPSSNATLAPPAPKPPLATTGYAEASISSASVSGTVDPRGVETSFYVQYGATTAYGAQTQPAAVGSGTQEVKISQAISGLQPDTTYHYRVAASSAAGTTTGEDRTFTTKKIPLTLTLNKTSHLDIFGTPFSISGTLAGSESANHAVTLQANPFPYLNGFKDVEPVEITDSAGDFSFIYTGLSQNTEFRVAVLGASPPVTTGSSPAPAPPTVVSPGFIELLAERVTLHVHSTARSGFMLVDGSVVPAQPGTVVAIQRLRGARKPEWVGKALAKRVNSHLSRFSATVHIRRPGMYRAFVEVTSGQQVSHYSPSVRIR
jgi:hypothetical protein